MTDTEPAQMRASKSSLHTGQLWRSTSWTATGASYSRQNLPRLPRCDLLHFSCYYRKVVISRGLYWNIRDPAKPLFSLDKSCLDQTPPLDGHAFADQFSRRGV